MRERPSIMLLPTGPGLDHSLYKEHVGPFDRLGGSDAGEVAARYFANPTEASFAGVEELVAALPQELVRYERFADAGHGVFRDRPETVSLLREFLFD